MVFVAAIEDELAVVFPQQSARSDVVGLNVTTGIALLPVLHDYCLQLLLKVGDA